MARGARSTAMDARHPPPPRAERPQPLADFARASGATSPGSLVGKAHPSDVSRPRRGGGATHCAAEGAARDPSPAGEQRSGSEPALKILTETIW
ncbi:MAG: hypothetical protein PHI35_07995 [Victivallaceae bacterium]|nr:hypothetical protein [Victivallaceae bacterium]